VARRSEAKAGRVGPKYGFDVFRQRFLWSPDRNVYFEENPTRLASLAALPFQGRDYQLAGSRLPSFAGVSATDSPQPQADVWFGLLNTNCAASLSTL
jgi:hypothetical protein